MKKLIVLTLLLATLFVCALPVAQMTTMAA